jgi:predicted nucleic acid-binding protein
VILVIDASVALKWFLDEEGSAQAAALPTRGDTLIAPDLIVPEVCNAAWKIVRRGLMHPEQQAAAVTRLPEILDVLVPTAPLAPRAAALSLLLDHPAYDCFYLALAEQRGATLITADRRLIQRLADTAWNQLVADLYTLPAE